MDAQNPQGHPKAENSPEGAEGPAPVPNDKKEQHQQEPEHPQDGSPTEAMEFEHEKPLTEADTEELSEEDTSEEPHDPFREEIYHIVEPPEGDDDDGFASIPAGPTEEVDFDDSRPSRNRSRRSREQRRRNEAREPRRAPQPAPVAQAPRKTRSLWPIIVAFIAAIIIIAVMVWLANKGGNSATPAQPPSETGK